MFVEMFSGFASEKKYLGFAWDWNQSQDQVLFLVLTNA